MFMPVMMQLLRKAAPGESGEKPHKPEDDGKARNILSTVGVDKTHGTEVFHALTMLRLLFFSFSCYLWSSLRQLFQSV